MSLMIDGWMPSVGSSSSITFGLVTKARAIASCCCWPTARDAKVTDWNARNTASVDESIKQQEARALWLNECANRPYLEDDEKAIKAGK